MTFGLTDLSPPRHPKKSHYRSIHSNASVRFSKLQDLLRPAGSPSKRQTRKKNNGCLARNLFAVSPPLHGAAAARSRPVFLTAPAISDVLLIRVSLISPLLN
jgi:hypothetical protein